MTLSPKPLHRGDDGFSLMELLVVVSLLSVVGTVVLTSILTSSSIQRKNDSIVLQRASAQLALGQMGRDLTVADPLTAATASSATMKVYVKGRCEVHRWYVTTGNALAIDVNQYPASTTCTNASGALTATQTRVVARNVSNGAAPLFTYSKWQSAQNARADIASPVAASSIGSVDRVQIDLRLATTTTPIAETESVDLRNVEIR
jgi:prepilin-type N-terminal cleavage/methylation domain-containing protein